MSRNYLQQLWRAIRGRADRDDTEIYEGSIKNDEGSTQPSKRTLTVLIRIDWNSSDESLPSPPHPPPPPPPHATIAPQLGNMMLIHLHHEDISKAGFNIRAVSGLYDAGWIYPEALNLLHGIQQEKPELLQGTCVEPPVAALENIIDASRETVTLARNAFDQLETTRGVISRCRCDAVLLHRKRVRYVDEGEKSYEGQLYFESSHFTIQEVGNKRLSFHFNDGHFASGKSRFEPLEEEI